MANDAQDFKSAENSLWKFAKLFFVFYINNVENLKSFKLCTNLFDKSFAGAQNVRANYVVGSNL